MLEVGSAVAPVVMSDLIDRLAGLPPEKRELLAQRLKAQGKPLPPEFIPPVHAVDGAYPVSFAQERLWFFDHLVPGSPVYNLPVTLQIHGDLRLDVLQRAVDAVVTRHEALRMTFDDANGTIIQRPMPSATVPITLHDLRHGSADQRERLVAEQVAQIAQRPFDLRRGPLITFDLLQIAENTDQLVLVVHHIVADGWSAGVFVRDVAACYTAFALGHEPILATLPIRYVDFVTWHRERTTGPIGQAGAAFWQERLAGAASVLELPTDRPRPAVQTFRGNTLTSSVPLALTQQIRAVCKQSGVTLFMFLVAAYQVLLARYTRTTDIVIGTPVAGRNQRETINLIGFFVNTVVLRTSLAGNPSVREVLERVRTTVLEALEHQDVPFEQLADSLSRERSLSHTPIFQVAFVLQNSPMQALELPNVMIEPLEIHSGVAKFDLHLDITETVEGLRLAIEYNTDLFDPATILRMLQHYSCLLEGFVVDQDRAVAALPLLDSSAYTMLVEDWNTTQRDYPQQTIQGLVVEQAAKTPNAIAVSHGSHQRPYGELVQHTSHLAHGLRANGVRHGDRVGVYLERGIPLVETLLGILLANAAYVPLDTTYPSDRLALMVDDSALTLVLTTTMLAPALPTLSVPVLTLDTIADTLSAYPDTPPPQTAGLDDLAYCMYTSGSTGQPKGVTIPHRALVRLVRNTNYVELTPSDVIAQAANVAFDAATFEIWGALANGARLVLLERDTLLSPQALATELERERITAIFLTTALFNQIAHITPTAFQHVRSVLFGGEAVDPACVRAILEAGPPERLLHVYGPTENTTFSTWHQVSDVDPTATTVPIGRPLANDRVYVLDPNGLPVPIGVPGELFVGGAGLAWGYHDRPTITAERFVPDPFGVRPGGRLYRTGDLVRWTSAGSLEFMGRIDQQVKLRGFRIELGEIEAALRSIAIISDATVIVREDRIGDKRLVAYVVADAALFDASAVRDTLQTTLPAYMIPAAVVPIAKLPINPNGKIDRAALPVPEFIASPTAIYEAPTTEVEQMLAEIWGQLLGINQVSRTANFFELGGDSILAIQVANRAAQHGLSLSTKDVFYYHSLAELAQVAKPSQPAVFALPAIAQLTASPSQPPFRAIVLDWAGTIDHERLTTALEALAVRHESLGAVIANDQLVCMARPFPVVPNAWPNELDPDTLQALLTMLSEQLNPDTGPLAIAAWGGDSRVVLLIHELAADASSWTILIEDLAHLYASNQPLPPHSVGLDTVVAACAVPSVASRATPEPSSPPSGSVNTATISLNAEQQAWLLDEVPSRYRLDPFEVAVLALTWVLQGTASAPIHEFGLEMRGFQRLPELADQRLVGALSPLLAVRIDLPAGGLPSLVPAFKEALRTAITAAQTHAWAAPLAAMPAAQAPRISLLHLPASAVGNAKQVSPQPTHVPVGGLIIHVEIYASTAQIVWIADAAAYSESTLVAYGAAFCAALETLAAPDPQAINEAYAPSDFPMANLDSTKLNALLTSINRTQRGPQS